ncbi:MULTISPECIES: LA2681 family HEPN domain-containing protein [unclassified Acinetobacter]|uniref:LA2681 family HEPN domain-containing protein n=1 Tax=Acinetobacter TaxID=469 RepID=UPI002577F8C0|nr:MULTISPECIES: LA2681 family HEPN domain-containing protein [unclassified Acinetobacter]MDM1756492.1 hypothetical protein [Acinetobacter sp. 256-1]MDM1759782.1 hypothetical protein [Acinetobacter sp. 251-1]
MMLIDIKNDLNNTSKLIDQGEFDQAYTQANKIFTRINRLMKNKQYFDYLFEVSGLFVDIGHLGKNSESSSKGLKILEDNFEYYEQDKKHIFYYFYANALNNIHKPEENTLSNVNFQNIDKLNHAKTMYWKAYKSTLNEYKTVPDEYLVNLANSLKSQYRIVEALQYYDRVNKKGKDIPQAWINRSESLIMLNKMTTSLSINMLKEIKTGYVQASQSSEVPKIWHEYYKYRVDLLEKQILELSQDHLEIDLDDEIQTHLEYKNLSRYRQWCLDSFLSLTEHGLYCKCSASDKDNLTIFENTVGDNQIASMELVLNRLKSEFGFARHLYYESLHNTEWTEIDNEQAFSELFNDEILGLNIERSRTAFRICFGILDKIGIAIFDLLNLKKENRELIYFHNFWNKNPERIEFFKNIKNPGLVALYSIANDLNSSKNNTGELSFYKKWRNLLEHDLMIIHKNDSASDIYDSYQGFKNKITFVNEYEFQKSLIHVLQLTRSAIFSFVFAVREHSKQNFPDENLIFGTLEILKKTSL